MSKPGEMTKEEAALILDGTVYLEPPDDTGWDDACDMGAAALRAIGPLEEKIVALEEERDALKAKIEKLERFSIRQTDKWRAKLDEKRDRYALGRLHMAEDLCGILQAKRNARCRGRKEEGKGVKAPGDVL